MFSNCNRKVTVAAAGLLVLGITSSLLLGHFTTRSPSTNHLDRRPGAEWIIYPAAPMTMEVQRTNLMVQFRREFVLDHPTASALVRVAACRSAMVKVNGMPCRETA